MSNEQARPCLPYPSRWFQTRDGILHYIDEGKGRPVVCLHGNPDWLFSYRKVSNRLLPDHRCLALDHLGFGYSAKPSEASYHPQAHADRLAAWIIALGLWDITLVVNDWGGPIALAFAQAYPERVRGLVLMNTWMWPLEQYWFFPVFSKWMSGVTGQWLTGYGNVFSKVLLWLAIYHKRSFSGSIHQCYQAPYPTPGDRIAQYTMPFYLMAASAWFRRLYQHFYLIPQQHTALVWGMRDPAFRPTFLRTWEALLPSAPVLRLYRAGHFPQEDQPESVYKAIAQVIR